MILRTAALVLPILLAASAASLDRYNEGVEHLGRGEIEKAVEAFEEAAVTGEGKLRGASLFNLALCHARRGEALREGQPEEEEETRDAKMERLSAAAESYGRALALFRRVPPPAPDAEEGIRAAKVRLLAVTDELRKLSEEARKEAEEQALKDPAGLILRTLSGERDRRRAASRLSALERRRRRLPSRRLRKAEYRVRTLVEKLAFALENPPEEVPYDAELGRKAAEPAGRAAKAMGEAEGRLDGLDAAGAVAPMGRAIDELAAAARLLPAPLPALVGKLLDDQSSLLGITRARDPALLPVEEREIVAWLEAVTRIPDPPRPAEGQAPGPVTAEVLSQVRELAAEASVAAGRAAAHLDARRLADSVPEQEEVIDKLTEIKDLLPKPPESPAERIRRLLGIEREVRESAAGLAGLNDDARAAETQGLAERQTVNGREADSIARTLEGSPGDREKAAAEKVRAAETEIHGSSESLRRDRIAAAGEEIDRAIAALEEALRILSGEQGDDRQEQPRPEKPRPEKQPEDEKEKEDARKLDAREARRMMEEMDRDRREEEEKLFPGGGGAKVEKDW